MLPEQRSQRHQSPGRNPDVPQGGAALTLVQGKLAGVESANVLPPALIRSWIVGQSVSLGVWHGSCRRG